VENSNVPYKVDVVDLSHTYVEEVADSIYAKIRGYCKLMAAIFKLILANHKITQISTREQ